MKIDKKIVVACTISLMAGISLGFLAKMPKTEKETSQLVRAEKKTQNKAKNLGDEATIKGLRAKIKDLENQLKSATAENKPGKEEKLEFPFPGNGEGFRRPSIANMRKFAEEFKKRDPEGYANMTNRMAQGMARRQERNMSRLDILSSIDVSKMSAKQKEVHETYQELLARQMELQNILNPQNAEATDDDRQQALEEMGNIHRDLRKYSEEERKILLAQTGEEMGISSKDVPSFIEVIETVYDVTGNHHRFPGRPPRR